MGVIEGVTDVDGVKEGVTVGVGDTVVELLCVGVKDGVSVDDAVCVTVPDTVGVVGGVADSDAPGDAVCVGVADDEDVCVGDGAMHAFRMTEPGSPVAASGPAPTNVVVPNVAMAVFT